MNVKSSQTMPDRPFELLSYYEQQYELKKQSVSDREQIHQGYFAFCVGDKHLLLEMKNIIEIVKSMPNIAPLPFSPAWLLGIGGLRGEVYSVIDLKCLFNINDTNYDHKKAVFLVLGHQAQGYILKVDDIIGIRDCDISQLDSDEQFFNGKGIINGEVYFKLDLNEITKDISFIHNER